MPHLASKFKGYIRHCCYPEGQCRPSVVPMGPGTLRSGGRVAVVVAGDIEKQC